MAPDTYDKLLMKGSDTNLVALRTTMIMPFSCSCRNKNSSKPYTLRVPSNRVKEGTCDDAATMTLVVQWWFFSPFSQRGKVLRPYRLTTLSAHLYK